MVEIKMKYKIGVRRFGLINWIGAWTLYKKEVLRFLVVWIQTIFSPLVSSLLFLLVLSLAIGAERGEVLGVPFITFLAPGLISMQVIQQAFSHSSSSFMIGKIQGNIVDILYAPLSPAEVTLLISLASVTRSVLIAIVSIITFKLIIDIQITNYFYGTFYTIDRLPEFLQTISKANPFFYMIDGFRYSFLGKADGSIMIGLIYLSNLSIVSWFITYLLYKKGYKLKS